MGNNANGINAPINELWENQIKWYNHDADNRKIRSDLIDEFHRSFNVTAKLVRINMYKCGFFSRKKSRRPYHSLIIFVAKPEEDEPGYFLVEKTTSCLFIQYSKSMDKLKKHDSTDRLRPKMQCTLADDTKEDMTLGDLFTFMNEEKSKGYDILKNNCQHFAETCVMKFANNQDYAKTQCTVINC